MNLEVSIVIPTYNRVKLLQRALESALMQDGTNFEVIISDDGSSDGTHVMLASINDLRVRCLTREKNVGMHVNMNTCLDAARGKYFLMLSDDDYLEPGCIQNLLKPWRSNPNIMFSYGQWWYERDGVRKLQQSSGPKVECGFDYVMGCWKGERPTIFHSVLFETESIRKKGGIPKGYAQDTFLKQMLAMEGLVAYVDVPVTTYCFHTGSTTNTINLFTLIHERSAVLDMCLQVATEKNAPSSYLKELNDLGRHQFLKDASHGIVSAFAEGNKRGDVLREALKLQKFLRYGLIQSLTALFLVIVMPRSVVSWLQRIYKSIPEKI